MNNYALTITIAALLILALVAAAIGAYIERAVQTAARSTHTHDDFENRYYIKGDLSGENIPLPYSWTMSDACFLRDMLRDKYMVGCVILYGNAERGLIEL